MGGSLPPHGVACLKKRRSWKMNKKQGRKRKNERRTKRKSRGRRE
jgi:hypothetical protein